VETKKERKKRKKVNGGRDRNSNLGNQKEVKMPSQGGPKAAAVKAAGGAEKEGGLWEKKKKKEKRGGKDWLWDPGWKAQKCSTDVQHR